jgi:hypothetical protein
MQPNPYLKRARTSALLGTLLSCVLVSSCAGTSRVAALQPPGSCLTCDPEPVQSADDSPESAAVDYNAMRSAGASCRAAVADCAEWSRFLIGVGQ